MRVWSDKTETPNSRMLGWVGVGVSDKRVMNSG